MPKFSANLSMLFGEHDFLDRFDAAARAGFAAVEYIAPYDHAPDVIAARLKKNGLTQALFNLPPGDWAAGERGIAVLPDRIHEFRQGVDKAIAYAQALGCTQVNCLAGIAPQGVDRDAVENVFVENLRFAAEKLKAAGVRLLIEPINVRDIPGFFLTNTKQALALIDKVGSDNLYLQYDIYHMQIMEGDVIRTIRDNKDYIGHYHTGGNPGRHEIDETQELNYPAIMRAILDTGYDGYVGQEFIPARDPLTSLAEGFRVCDV